MRGRERDALSPILLLNIHRCTKSSLDICIHQHQEAVTFLFSLGSLSFYKSHNCSFIFGHFPHLFIVDAWSTAKFWCPCLPPSHFFPAAMRLHWSDVLCVLVWSAVVGTPQSSSATFVSHHCFMASKHKRCFIVLSINDYPFWHKSYIPYWGHDVWKTRVCL